MPTFAFTDLMYREKKPPLKVRATLSFLSTEEGGRNAGVLSGYRPNHNFGLPDGREFYIGQVDFELGQMIQPGESREVSICFIQGPGLIDKLQLGQTWRIQEGPKLVAIGEVLEIMYET